ncbi:hypothetical protein PMI01_03166 [Caulobacter sp. AP07]|uniref:hypothetical protein n=1 Tax=Caulobacter sp. AP07 TaxID=1144304 RepID=UPI000271FCBC|nr:hypothetical protein [Caulobacter sp. AP07]EJL30388.1 hypothetical protein PMI01_03166 [Caulobacter sp. AP07]
MSLDPLMEKLRPGFRARQEAQRSWWKPIERLLVIGLAFGLMGAFSRYALWPLHVAFHPKDTERFAEILRGPVQPQAVVVLLALIWPAVCLGGVVVNSAVYWVPPLRRVSEKGGDRHPELNIGTANRALLKAAFWGALIGLPVAALISASPFGG